MEFLKPLSIFSLGFYSAIGVATLIALYFLFYGARCADSWMKRQPMPTDRVWAYVCGFHDHPDTHSTSIRTLTPR